MASTRTGVVATRLPQPRHLVALEAHSDNSVLKQEKNQQHKLRLICFSLQWRSPFLAQRLDERKPLDKRKKPPKKTYQQSCGQSCHQREKQIESDPEHVPSILHHCPPKLPPALRE